ncbi:SHOCT domain-containing protein [bacterium]|nr:SHOCT domain-containing protein [bacterium]
MHFFHEGYHFWGMHLIWWIIWVVLLFWIFAIPEDIPGQRKKKESALDLLKRKYASGEYTTQEYLERKRNLEIH